MTDQERIEAAAAQFCEKHGCEMFPMDCSSCHGDGETYGYREDILGDGYEECWRCKGTGQTQWKECRECLFESENE